MPLGIKPRWLCFCARRSRAASSSACHGVSDESGESWCQVGGVLSCEMEDQAMRLTRYFMNRIRLKLGLPGTLAIGLALAYTSPTLAQGVIGQFGQGGFGGGQFGQGGFGGGQFGQGGFGGGHFGQGAFAGGQFGQRAFAGGQSGQGGFGGGQFGQGGFGGGQFGQGGFGGGFGGGQFGQGGRFGGQGRKFGFCG